MRRVSRWLALDRRPGRGAGLPTVEVVAAEDYDRVLREVNDLRDQVQMYEEKAERDWRDFGEMQDARIAADDRVVELEKKLARVCKQLDSANDMVERDGETPQNRRDLEAREDWRAARVDAINRGDLSFDRGFISGLAAGRAAATPDPPTDERRPWPIAPDTVMPPRRQPVRWGSRADDPPTEIHDDPGKTKAYLAGLAAGRTEAAAASPDERLREALRDANEYLAQIADYSPSEVADAIDSVRVQIKDALAVTDSRGKPDGASVPDQSCATCGGSGDRNGNRRAADPFGTCPGCGGTGKVAAADREAPDRKEG